MEALFNTRSCLSRKELRQYLAGRLSEEQQFEVENHLLDCPLCSAAAEGLAEENGIEAEADITAINNRIEQESQSIDQAPSKSGIIRMRWANRAAAVALVCLLIYAVFQYQQSTITKRLVDQYLTPPASEYLSLRGQEPILEGLPPSLKKAVEHYSAEQFAESIPLFEAHLRKQPKDESTRLLLATAYLEAGSAADAESLLRVKQDGQAQALSEGYQWYLALSLLAQEKNREAKSILKELANHSPAFRKRATDLLEEL